MSVLVVLPCPKPRISDTLFDILLGLRMTSRLGLRGKQYSCTNKMMIGLGGLVETAVIAPPREGATHSSPSDLLLESTYAPCRCKYEQDRNQDCRMLTDMLDQLRQLFECRDKVDYRRTRTDKSEASKTLLKDLRVYNLR